MSNKSENECSKFSSTLSNQFQDPKLMAFWSISFTHHYEILLKTENESDRLFYINTPERKFGKSF
jgi:hypothetical protein